MTDTEKLILEKLDALNQKINEVSAKVDAVDEKVDMVDAKVNAVDAKVDMVNDRVTKTNLLIENEISKKIDIIGEGHDFLNRRLDDALQMEVKREKMELELINLRMEVNKIKTHLDIA